jgi:hypothetical protein
MIPQPNHICSENGPKTSDPRIDQEEQKTDNPRLCTSWRSGFASLPCLYLQRHRIHGSRTADYLDSSKAGCDDSFVSKGRSRPPDLQSRGIVSTKLWGAPAGAQCNAMHGMDSRDPSLSSSTRVIAQCLTTNAHDERDTYIQQDRRVERGRGYLSARRQISPAGIPARFVNCSSVPRSRETCDRLARTPQRARPISPSRSSQLPFFGRTARFRGVFPDARAIEFVDHLPRLDGTEPFGFGAGIVRPSTYNRCGWTFDEYEASRTD